MRQGTVVVLKRKRPNVLDGETSSKKGAVVTVRTAPIEASGRMRGWTRWEIPAVPVPGRNSVKNGIHRAGGLPFSHVFEPISAFLNAYCDVSSDTHSPSFELRYLLK